MSYIIGRLSINRIYMLLLVLVPFFSACEKHKIKRKYTGDFLFTVNSHTWNMSSGTHDATYTFEGKIELSKEVPTGTSEDNVYIKVYYKSLSSFEYAIIEKDGKFHFLRGGGGRFSGDDQLDFGLSSTQLSSSVDDTVHGVRR